jgi:hypothetical protein
MPLASESLRPVYELCFLFCFLLYYFVSFLLVWCPVCHLTPAVEQGGKRGTHQISLACPAPLPNSRFRAGQLEQDGWFLEFIFLPFDLLSPFIPFA